MSLRVVERPRPSPGRTSAGLNGGSTSPAVPTGRLVRREDPVADRGGVPLRPPRDIAPCGGCGRRPWSAAEGRGNAPGMDVGNGAGPVPGSDDGETWARDPE